MEPRKEEKESRFRIEKLEERIAPDASPECIAVVTGVGVCFSNCSRDRPEPPPRVIVDGRVLTRD